MDKNIEVSESNNLKENLIIFNSRIEDFNDLLEKVNDIGKTVVAFKQINRDMKTIEANVSMFIKNSDNKLKKHTKNASIIENNLSKISINIQVCLDKALAIDTKTHNVEEIKFRNNLLEQVKNWSSSIEKLLMHLMLS